MLKNWPIILIVFSNVFYHICSKSAPKDLNPLAMLVITYSVGAITSLIAFLITNPGVSLLNEYKHLNWTAFILGIAIVGLEAGYICLYKLGWNINTGYLITSMVLSISLLFVGLFLYNERITLTKIVGILVCLLGIFILRK